MNLLGIDTSTSSTVLGLLMDDDLIDFTSAAVKTHSMDILPSIHSLLGESGVRLKDLDAIVFGQGPGSFTGLRIAVGVTQGLAYGLGIPVVPVSSMACIAFPVCREADQPCVLVALTARLEEVYYGAYKAEGSLISPVLVEGVLDVQQLPVLPAGYWVGMGDAFPALLSGIEASTGLTFDRVLPDAVPRIENLLAMGADRFLRGDTVTAAEASPVYLREQVATRPGK